MKEHDLYPLLSEHLWDGFKIYSKRIEEKRSSNKQGAHGNKWLFQGKIYNAALAGPREVFTAEGHAAGERGRDFFNGVAKHIDEMIDNPDRRIVASHVFDDFCLVSKAHPDVFVS